MQTDPTPTDQTPDTDSPLSPEDEAILQRIKDPVTRAGLRSIKRSIDARAAAAAASAREAAERLPRVDEAQRVQTANSQHRIEQESETLKNESLKAEKAKLLKLPVFPQEARPSVNVIANSALFAAVQGKDRQLLNDAHLDTQDGIDIIFSGQQFNQDDHDVLMQLVYLASQSDIGQPITVSAHSLLKALGRGTSGKEHQQLKAEINRLVKGTIQLKTKRFDYIGHLIDDAQQDKETKLWTYRTNPTLGKFYDADRYTLINWEDRKALKGKDLARWLQLQLASHARPFPIKVETIRRLSGSRTKSLRHFREKLKIALEDLKVGGFIESWLIDAGDLVHVERGDATSASQQRHLAKPAARRRLPKPKE